MSDNEKNTGIATMFRLGITLAIFAVVACVLLALVYQCTAGRIAENANAKTNMAMRAVFPSADSFEEIDPAEYEKNVGNVVIENMYLVKSAGQVVGIATRASGPTFERTSLLVGQDLGRQVTGVEVLDTTDTQGFGSKSKDPSYKISTGQTFAGQFAGKDASDGFEVGRNFEGISGATTTSRGIANILSAATSAAGNYLASNYSGDGDAFAGGQAAQAAADGNLEGESSSGAAKAGGPGIDAPFEYDGALEDLASIAGIAGATFQDVTGRSAGTKIRNVFTVERLYTISSGGKVVAVSAAVRGPTYSGEGVAITTVNAERKIIGMRIIELPDAAEYAVPNLASAFYRQFENLRIDVNLLSGQQYDAIAGASITSDCLADIIKVGADEAAKLMMRHGGEREPDGLPPYTLNNHRNH